MSKPVLEWKRSFTGALLADGPFDAHYIVFVQSRTGDTRALRNGAFIGDPFPDKPAAQAACEVDAVRTMHEAGWVRADADLRAENERLRAALVDAEDTLAIVEHPRQPDPLFHDEVKRLGQRIGFGALMATASTGWVEANAAEGYPTSGAFVAGPCIGTVQATLKRIRGALSPTSAPDTSTAPSLLDHHPDLGTPTPAPSLREIVEKYYRYHDIEQWQSLTEAYFAAHPIGGGNGQ